MCHTQDIYSSYLAYASSNRNALNILMLNGNLSYDTLLGIIEANNAYLASVLEQNLEMTATIQQFEQAVQKIRDFIINSRN
ncbi:unnamed protein product [Blepharisma stoltei]|uniref:Uncharacterized protein n=1 Tax=Blepharisma stoltei TaxID=1481888 RepID=A0AAU9IVR5_9CILI|nr:unnamed protein product [Blepharisma stoltei]